MLSIGLEPDFGADESTLKPVTKAAISLLIIAHFVAIAVAVTSYSTPNFPAPQLAVEVSQPMQPYLQGTFLNNAYRFFAPNPGVPTVLWIRLQTSDGRVRWAELPGRPESALVRATYQRRLNLALLVGQQMEPDPDQSGKPRLTPLGETCLASLIRHVVREEENVSSVGVYLVQHAVITPQQVRDGWTPNDLRTYRPMFLGVFSAGGEPRDKNRSMKEQSIFQVTAGILWADVHPLLRSKSPDPEVVLESLHLPSPVQQFLRKRRELLDTSLPSEGLSERVEAAAAKGGGDA